MSKEQWGHGYYAGLKDAQKLGKEKFVCEYDEHGNLSHAGLMWEVSDESVAIAWLDYLDMYEFCFLDKCKPTASDVDIENVYEIPRKDLNKYVVKSTWVSVVADFTRLHNVWREKGDTVKEPKEKTISQILEEVASSICDDYCKFPNECKSEEELYEICEDCPLGRL